MATDDIADLLSQLSLPSYSELAPEHDSPAYADESTLQRRPTPPPTGVAYVVFVGLETGVYPLWSDCEKQIKGVPHNSHKQYPCFAAAEKAYIAAKSRGLVCTAEERAADVRRRIVERQRLRPQDLPLCLHFLEDATSKAMAPNPSRWYVVIAGLQPGVYLTFHECSYLTSGYGGAVHQSFYTRDAAVREMERALAAGQAIKFILE
ncbi:hypothetical protein K525DRAFT_290029 [Schizophyllum commune Loenen D]|nr:hypothetical protein K525DRAFT_290029 [Schizophyllum commune Loenen D]